MSRLRTRVATVSVALAMLLLSACGSQLAPGDVVAAGGTAVAICEAACDAEDPAAVVAAPE